MSWYASDPHGVIPNIDSDDRLVLGYTRRYVRDEWSEETTSSAAMYRGMYPGEEPA